jgi:NhaA family Na+:H+ antiporter
VARGRALLDRFDDAAAESDGDSVAGERQAVLHTLEQACERVQTPLSRMEHGLHPWVTFAIMPVFALANAGVALTNSSGGIGGGLGSTVALGVIFGLLIGKPLGVTLFAYLAVRAGLAALPYGVTWRHVFGAGWLGGIGFTMSLFITGLAFADTPLAATAKIAILSASFLAGVIGFLLLRATSASAD